ncbi:expressed unknown protein [Seminavis robusta]|uniref:Uncharacterized protein n=1 Tax=Seminavis robusta TaxID=568900 RepID=A0A9N8H701_9STRA|nr:expressed unknown protein [Seminavis robusta]|eukprot:Sro57_g033131.1  (131) ;mRNA; f:15817-16209
MALWWIFYCRFDSVAQQLLFPLVEQDSVLARHQNLKPCSIPQEQHISMHKAGRFLHTVDHLTCAWVPRASTFAGLFPPPCLLGLEVAYIAMRPDAAVSKYCISRGLGCLVKGSNCSGNLLLGFDSEMIPQ